MGKKLKIPNLNLDAFNTFIKAVDIKDFTFVIEFRNEIIRCKVSDKTNYFVNYHEIQNDRVIKYDKKPTKPLFLPLTTLLKLKQILSVYASSDIKDVVLEVDYDENDENFYHTVTKIKFVHKDLTTELKASDITFVYFFSDELWDKLNQTTSPVLALNINQALKNRLKSIVTINLDKATETSSYRLLLSDSKIIFENKNKEDKGNYWCIEFNGEVINNDVKEDLDLLVSLTTLTLLKTKNDKISFKLSKNARGTYLVFVEEIGEEWGVRSVYVSSCS